MSSDKRLIVVSDRKDLPTGVGRVVTADEFLAGDREVTRKNLEIVNLCRAWRYLSKGYYVSLLADARGQTVLPTVATMEGIASPHVLFRALQEAGVPTIDAPEMTGRRKALPSLILTSDEPGSRWKKRDLVPLVRHSVRGKLVFRPALDAEIAETLVVLGLCKDKRFHRIGSLVYRAWPSPILRVRLLLEEEEWKVIHVAPLMAHRLQKEEREELIEALRKKSAGTLVKPSPDEGMHASLAVLFDENDVHKPSIPETIDRLERIAAKRGLHVRCIGPSDKLRLADYDALFIRILTGLDQPSFRFAQRAEALGMPVIDDTRSIIRCSNKVFLYELLSREGVATPRTVVASQKSRFEELVKELGLPFILKLPDGSFSSAVHKVSGPEDYKLRCEAMFKDSPLVIAQAYTPSAFDWRVTTLDGKPLFVAKYYMAPGHWQIRNSTTNHGAQYGKVEAVPRDLAPRDVVRLACKASKLIGDGLYGVDLKETPQGPVVIEVNDNPNIDTGYDDAADGNVIYEELVAWFLKRIEQVRKPAAPKPPPAPKEEESAMETLRKPIGRPPATDRSYQAFEVCGLELEYPIVDRGLQVQSLVEPAFHLFAGRATSDVGLGVVGFSNEIYDHVFEIKTTVPLKSLVETEEVLVEGLQRFSLVLSECFGARLLPTGMHPWLNPADARLWSRSNSRIYGTYARLFNVKTHGWANVQACHVNLPMGREHEAVAMMNAAAMLVPYLPALAASTPMYDGALQSAVDNRLAFILEHQSRIPESCGEMVPEFIDSLSQYRRDVLSPMYRAVDRLPDAKVLRHEYFNARAAVFKFSRDSMEVRVLDVQECVKMDVAIACFTRAALKGLSERILSGKLALPPHAPLVADFHAAIREGTSALVHAPHLGQRDAREEDGRLPIRVALRELLALARKKARAEEGAYLDLVAGVIEKGNLSERMAAVLRRHVDGGENFTDAVRRLYVELADCLLANEPWAGRGL